MKILEVKVKPSSRISELVLQEDGTFIAKLKSAPVDGKANKELIALIAKHFKISKTKIQIKTGSKARLKLVELN